VTEGPRQKKAVSVALERGVTKLAILEVQDAVRGDPIREGHMLDVFHSGPGLPPAWSAAGSAGGLGFARLFKRRG
jgi:hypothetical protein